MYCRNWNKICLLMAMLFCFTALTNVASAKKDDEKKVILYVPQDDRPISSDQTADVIRALGYTVEMPPKDLLGDRNRNGRPEELNRWLVENGGENKVAVVSADALTYGSLVTSRKHHIPKDMLARRVKNIGSLHEIHPEMPVYVFSSVMRTPKDGASSGTEEPEYYVEYGKAIATYTKIDNADTSGLDESYQVALREGVPEAALNDWFGRRKMNFEVNCNLINLVKNDNIEYMAVGLDDNAKFSLTQKEGDQLENYARNLGLDRNKFDAMTGLDEVGLLVLTRVVNKLDNYHPRVYVKYAPGFGGATVPSYSGEPIDKTIEDQITAVGALKTYDLKKADLVLMINTNRSGWTYDANTPVNTLQLRYNTLDFANDIEKMVDSGYHVSIGDIAFANGADNALMNLLQKRDILDRLYGYAGWNTATNSTGFALSMGIISNRINKEKRDRLLLTRYLDDWVYQANIRQNVNSYINLLPGKGNYLTIGDSKLPHAEEYGTKLMRDFAAANLNLFAKAIDVSITMPWDRIFEANINLERGKYDDTVLKKYLKGH